MVNRCSRPKYVFPFFNHLPTYTKEVIYITSYNITMLEEVYMPKPKIKRDDLEKLIVRNLIDKEPQTKNETSKAIHKKYKPTWYALKNLEKQKLIKQATTKPYNNIEYPRYWLTDEGIIKALIEGANSYKLLEQTKRIYPENENIHCFLEIAPLFDPQVLRITYSSVKGKGKLGFREIIMLFLSQPSIAMDAEKTKKLTTILKKYPDEYNILKNAVQEMINQLKQLQTSLLHDS